MEFLAPSYYWRALLLCIKLKSLPAFRYSRLFWSTHTGCSRPLLEVNPQFAGDVPFTGSRLPRRMVCCDVFLFFSFASPYPFVTRSFRDCVWLPPTFINGICVTYTLPKILCIKASTIQYLSFCAFWNLKQTNELKGESIWNNTKFRLEQKYLEFTEPWLFFLSCRHSLRLIKRCLFSSLSVYAASQFLKKKKKKNRICINAQTKWDVMR